MALLFKIKKRFDSTGDYYIWELYSEDEKICECSDFFFNIEAAREEIYMIKKKITMYTKVEVEE